MLWFKHDTDASTDAKIKKLLLRFGPEGYAVYFHCLELIASDVCESNITFQLEHDSEIIADNLKIKGTKDKSGIEIVEDIMRYIIQLGLFSESEGKIFCFKMLKRLDTSMTSNTRFRALITSAKSNHDGVMTVSCSGHDTIMQEEKRKEETRLERIPCPEEPDSVPYKEVVEYLNQVCSTSYKPSSQKTRGLIKARFNDGFTLNDFKTVIKKKYAKWGKTEMAQYLRPVTLFGQKFESYLNEIDTSIPEPKQTGLTAEQRHAIMRGEEL